MSDRFQTAEQNLVEHHLITLELMGEARQSEDGRYHPVEEPAVLWCIATGRSGSADCEIVSRWRNNLSSSAHRERVTEQPDSMLGFLGGATRL